VLATMIAFVWLMLATMIVFVWLVLATMIVFVWEETKVLKHRTHTCPT